MSFEFPNEYSIEIFGHLNGNDRVAFLAIVARKKRQRINKGCGTSELYRRAYQVWIIGKRSNTLHKWLTTPNPQPATGNRNPRVGR